MNYNPRQTQYGLPVESDFFLWNSDFYRESSDRVEFGSRWTLGSDEATWMVYWLTDTGELYAKPWLDEDNRYILLGYFPTLEDVEQRMSGWQDLPVKDLILFCLPPHHPAQKQVAQRVEARLQQWQANLF